MKWLIKALFKVTKLFINGILLPIDLIINSLFPDLEYVISHVTAFLNWLVDFVHWVMSWLPFSSTFYSILVACVTFKIMVPLTIHTIKLVIKWYNALVP